MVELYKVCDEEVGNATFDLGLTNLFNYCSSYLNYTKPLAREDRIVQKTIQHVIHQVIIRGSKLQDYEAELQRAITRADEQQQQQRWQQVPFPTFKCYRAIITTDSAEDIAKLFHDELMQICKDEFYKANDWRVQLSAILSLQLSEYGKPTFSCDYFT